MLISHVVTADLTESAAATPQNVLKYVNLCTDSVTRMVACEVTGLPVLMHGEGSAQWSLSLRNPHPLQKRDMRISKQYKSRVKESTDQTVHLSSNVSPPVMQSFPADKGTIGWQGYHWLTGVLCKPAGPHSEAKPSCSKQSHTGWCCRDKRSCSSSQH